MAEKDCQDNDVFDALKRLLKSEKYSDLTIKCQQETFKVHRAVVCMRSPFFETAANGDFKEGKGEIDLPEDEVSVIRELITYLYTWNYNDVLVDESGTFASKIETPEEPELPIRTPTLSKKKKVSKTLSQVSVVGKCAMPVGDSSTLVFNVKMYIAGDKFRIPALKTLAKVKFQEKVALYWNSVHFSEAARLLWENTMDSDRLLRDAFVDCAQKNVRVLMTRGEFVELMSAYGEICLEVMKKALGSQLQCGHRCAPGYCY